MEAFVASKRDAKQKEELVPLSEVVDPSVGQGRQQSETLRLVFCAVRDWLGRFAPVGFGSGFFLSSSLEFVHNIEQSVRGPK